MPKDTYLTNTHFMQNDDNDDDDTSSVGSGSPSASANGLDETEEASLLDAVRSATEMLAAEGLGSMVDIDSLQKQRAAMHQDSARQPAGDSEGLFDYGTEYDTGASAGELDEDDVLGSDDEEEIEDEDDVSLSQEFGEALRESRSIELRSAGTRRVNYNENMDVDSGAEDKAAGSDVEGSV
ncbi:hypothetical protein GGI15_003191, partial [Coemansia interrupta]